MATKKKIKPKKKPTLEAGLESLVEAKQKQIKKEEEEFAAKHPPFKRKLLISDEASLNATVASIAEFVGVFELDSYEVQNLKEFISTGQLSFTRQKGVEFSLRRPIEISKDNRKKDFVLSEMTDGEMEDMEVDGFEVGMLVAMGRKTEVPVESIRKIAAGAISLPVDLIGKLSTKDILAIYGLYILFFLGR